MGGWEPVDPEEGAPESALHINTAHAAIKASWRRVLGLGGVHAKQMFDDTTAVIPLFVFGPSRLPAPDRLMLAPILARDRL